ncbi:phosphatase PAP2 family protein [Streptomyces sp. RS10V-4]|uniref:phosphatase PAP2 family protein n=1 Tax=Streptomyces rhizoryzae TaxID=2932493 RepID=UPI002002DFF5|nr:phosphatase PAP2 family protein [Streptomyces rhizoryzae]MCK7626677.1 phosphatase PAP2 family protein [Streptomyces rhizoryzae]
MTPPGASPHRAGGPRSDGARPALGRGPRLGAPPGRLLVAAALCAALFTAAALTVALRHGVPLGPERAALHWATAHRGEPLRSLARALTATGTGAVPYLMALLAGLLAGRTARGRLRAVLCAVAFLAAAQAVRYGLMALLARPRPPVADWATTATGYSFPSGHATTSALAAGILAWGVLHRTRPGRGRTWCAVLALWAAGVGLTRVYLGVHWAGDVLGGWLLAGALLALALLLADPVAVPRRTGPGSDPAARP